MFWKNKEKCNCISEDRINKIESKLYKLELNEFKKWLDNLETKATIGYYKVIEDGCPFWGVKCEEINYYYNLNYGDTDFKKVKKEIEINVKAKLYDKMKESD